MQVVIGKVLASLLSKTKVTSLCKSENLTLVSIGIANNYLYKIGKKIGPNEICKTIGCNSILQRAYTIEYKKIQFCSSSRWVWPMSCLSF